MKEETTRAKKYTKNKKTPDTIVKREGECYDLMKATFNFHSFYLNPLTLTKWGWYR